MKRKIGVSKQNVIELSPRLKIKVLKHAWSRFGMNVGILGISGTQTHHFIHKVLNAHLVQNTIRVDKKNEEVVVPLKVFGINLVDELEGPFLTVSLSSMREARNSDTGAAVGNVQAVGIAVEGEWNAQTFNCLEIQFILLVSIK